ncbi:hypothetical protein Plav_1944 [Parvibaculum lavamentivorans DS-1]|uniref:Uncharacterized protein n=1 Tax=Parvibaculum lavamentivorans (strain DS-1 / DSM 13023 / NCIMB 13966) TaxID=402881 RepID=A7HUH6_PARL1|nr:hypothetical protein [Parvibaculum lavamentivorans]ABS63559.1 hypothetical protein Plav_1944 [Parvibaculum lavamentivorans DS-1]
MSNIGRLTSFPLGGDIAWQLSAPPQWRRFAPSMREAVLLPEPVAWSADFATGAYLRAGHAASPGDMFVCVRSSPALMQGEDGLHVFAADEAPVLPGIGLDVWGQFQNRCTNHNANPAGLVNISKGGAAAVLSVVDDAAALAEAGLSGVCSSGKVYKLDNSAGSGVAWAWAAGQFASATPHTPSLYYRGSACQLGFAQSGGASVSGARTDLPASAAYVAAEGPAYAPSSSSRWWALYAGPGATVHFVLNQLVESSFAVPPIVTGGAAATRFASDIVIPAFDVLAPAFALGEGFRGRDIIDLVRLSDPSPRTIWSRGTDDGNCITLAIGTGNKLRLSVRNGGADDLVLETAEAFAAPGRKVIDYVCANGAWSLEATGVAGGAHGGSCVLPALAAARIGSAFGGGACLNGAVEFSSIERIS